MRTIVVLGVTLLVALSSAAGDEPTKPNASRLRLVCSLAKGGLTILPAESEPAAKDSTLLIIICDRMRLGSDGEIVVENVTIETKDGTISAKELALHLDQGPSISFHSPDGGGIREIAFKLKAKAEPPK